MNIESVLLAARARRPYYARAQAALTPVPRPGMGTVAVDKYWRLYYDAVFLDGLTQVQAAEIIGGHEVEHLLRDHDGRRSGREARAWNVACDAEINDDLDAVDLTAQAVFPASLGKPNGLLAEEYYDAAMQEGGGGMGDCQSPAEPLPAPGDCDTPGVKPGEMAEALRDAVANDVRESERTKPGTVPAKMRVWAETRAARLKKSPNWRSVLRAAVGRELARHGTGAEATYTRPARRQGMTAGILPGRRKPRPHLNVLFDTSGSMDGQRAERALAVAQALRRMDAETVAWCADGHEIRPVDLARPRWTGGGGSDIGPAISAAAKGARMLVVVTDGELSSWGPAPACPVVVCCIAATPSVPWPCRIVEVR